LEPGHKASVDFYQSTILGRLSHTKGKEPEDENFARGTIFYNIASKFIFVKHLAAASTLESKHALERIVDEFGIKINNYVSDNHPFKSLEFG
jgi:hypothetical protein